MQSIPLSYKENKCHGRLTVEKQSSQGAKK